MRTFIAILLTASVMASGALVAQEIPENILKGIKAKAAQVNPDNKSARKKWIAKQKNAYDSINNSSYSIDEGILKTIKLLADKKFPFDYVSQEAFIIEQTQHAESVLQYKNQLGDAAFDAVKNDYLKSGKTDLEELARIMGNAATAKTSLSKFAPAGIDADTLAIAKQIIEKKFPNNYAAQLEALKKQFPSAGGDAVSSASAAVAGTAATADAGTTVSDANNASNQPQRPLSIGDLQKRAKKMFEEDTFIVESEGVKYAGIVTEIMGKKVVLCPFAAFKAGTPLMMNRLGEQVDFAPEDAYASKNLPIVIVFPKDLPDDIKRSDIYKEEDFRSSIDKTGFFFVGQSGINIQTFPVKITAIAVPQISLSARVPNTFIEGTLLVDTNLGKTAGMLVKNNPPAVKIDWNSRESVRRTLRTIESAGRERNIFMKCLRLDKFSGWEKLDREKLDKQNETLKRLEAVTIELMKLASSSRLSEGQNYPILGSTIRKHYPELRKRAEKQRYEGKFKAYLQDVIALIRGEMRSVEPNEFYTIHRADVVRYIDILNSLKDRLEHAMKTNSLLNVMPEDLKQIYTRQQ